jgi:NodT family efflux transporter outer membrane factor (OMF) lipoprotein
MLALFDTIYHYRLPFFRGHARDGRGAAHTLSDRESERNVMATARASFAHSCSRVARIVAACACASMAGCAVGPDFRKPAPPDVGDYDAHPVSTTVSTNVAGGNAQRFVNGGDIAADWWTLFHSEALNALIAEALANNSDMKAAQAALSAAHENVLAQRGAYYPSISAGISASREQDPPGALAPVPSNNAFLYNLYTPQLSISYMPDVFGLNYRTVESLKAQEDNVRYQMAATYTTLTSNIVVTAIQQGALEAEIDATHQIIDFNEDMIRILRYQTDKGYASGVDLAAQESQLAQAKATLPPLIKQSAQLDHQLAVLAGRFPNHAPEKFELSSLNLPEDVPVSLPSQLVAQRPDVLQAQANLHAASAQVGIATANRLPNIQLTANAGSTALAIGQVFESGTGFWSLGAALTAPIFDGGTLQHQERAAKATYVQAANQYRSTVLAALKDVADTLTALDQDAEGLKSAAAAADAAKVTLELSQRQWHDGYASYLALLTAEQAYQQALISLVQAQADRYADTAALFQALGGGWWHREDLTESTALPVDDSGQK